MELKGMLAPDGAPVAEFVETFGKWKQWRIEPGDQIDGVVGIASVSSDSYSHGLSLGQGGVGHFALNKRRSNGLYERARLRATLCLIRILLAAQFNVCIL